MKLQDFPVASGLFSLLFACVRAAEAPKPISCFVHNNVTKDLYDLSSLVKTTGENYKIYSNETQPNGKNHTFQLNVCEALPTTPTGIVAGDGIAATITGDDAKEISLGKKSNVLVLREGGVVLTYTGGASCTKDSKRTRSAKILFTCIDSLIVRSPTFVDDFDECEYVFEWKTPAACPTSDTNLSASTIFLRFAGIAIFFYLLIGILYKRFVRNAQGLEQIPNFDFWYGIYDFVKDMTIIIAIKVWDFLSSCRSKPSHYNSVPRGDMNALNIDDDDDDDEL